ncbi:putative SP-containing membrane protein [Vairimorpha necatrix]|uniref:SP-containing membrane protein n=1 Tax=Vairimorpha necatrix TaxID=6039 RepID=A0AAX4JCM2_9MICR
MICSSNILYLLFMTIAIQTINNEEFVLNSLVFYSNNCDDVVDTQYNLALSESDIQIFYDLIWNIITNHYIFKRITQNDTAEHSFVVRRDIIHRAFDQKFGRKIVDFSLWKQVIAPEELFVNEILKVVDKFYIMLRLCYKDTIKSAMSAKNAIKDIVSRNICFIPKGINENLPTIVYKECKNLTSYYDDCYSLKHFKEFQKEILKNQNLLLKAECSNVSNSFYDFTTEIYSVSDTTISNNNNTTSFFNDIINNNIKNIIINENLFAKTHDLVGVFAINSNNITENDNITDTVFQKTSDISTVNIGSDLIIGIVSLFIFISFFIFFGIMCYKRKRSQRNSDSEIN